MENLHREIEISPDRLMPRLLLAQNQARLVDGDESEGAIDYCLNAAVGSHRLDHRLIGHLLSNVQQSPNIQLRSQRLNYLLEIIESASNGSVSEVAKTGTRSLNQLFEEKIDDYVYLTRFSARHPKERDPSDFDFSFTIVRNPWSRSWSAWNNKIRGCDPEADNVGAQRVMNLARGDLGLARSVTESYPLFVQHLRDSRLYRGDIHFMPQTSLLKGRRLDYIGRCERYAAEVEHILGCVGLADCASEIPHRNISSDSGAFLNNLDDETAGILGDLYRQDVERFNYRSPFG